MDVRWPATLLALLVGAGTLKSSPALAPVPVDLTAFAAALIALGAFHTLASALWARSYLPAGLSVGAVGVGALGLHAAPMGEYAEAKVPALLVLTIGCSLIGALWLVRTERQRMAFAWGTVAVAVAVAVLVWLAPATGAELEGRLALSGAATIAPARLVGAGAVVLIALILAKRVRLLWALPMTLTFLAVMLATGSRGPVVALVVAVLGLMLLLRVGRMRALGLAGVLGLMGFQIFTDSGASIQDRFLLLFEEDRGSSIAARESMRGIAWETIKEHPFGVGWGNLSTVLPPPADYPHNVFLEVAAEGGLVAVVALLVALVVGVRRVLPAARAASPDALVMLGLLVFWLVNASVSGDLNDNRGLFVVLAACLMMSKASPTQAVEEEQEAVPASRGRVASAGRRVS